MTSENVSGHSTGSASFSTADAEGRMDAAVYSRSHVSVDGTVAFALAPGGSAVLFATPRGSRKFRNLRANPR